MKVISLLQPWATLVVVGAKQIETRSWNTNFRGDILIHASKKFTRNQKALCLEAPFKNFIQDFSQLPLGAIIGKVTLMDTQPTDFYLTTPKSASRIDLVYWWSGMPCIGQEIIADHEKAFGDYSPGRYGWLLHTAVPFQKPIPAKGSLGLWEFPESKLV
jgi:hypothetical protein